MINSVVGGLVYIKVRRVMELFPPRLRTLWKDWELHAMVLLSLTLQMILILVLPSLTLQMILKFFGNRRKYTNRKMCMIKAIFLLSLESNLNLCINLWYKRILIIQNNIYPGVCSKIKAITAWHQIVLSCFSMAFELSIVLPYI